MTRFSLFDNGEESSDHLTTAVIGSREPFQPWRRDDVLISIVSIM